MLFCPALLLALCAETAWGTWKKPAAEDGKDAVLLLWTVLAVAVIAGILGAVNGFGFFSGVLGQVNFLTFEALTGASFIYKLISR